MALTSLVNIQGSLGKTVPMLDLATIQHADEITKDRRTLSDEEQREELRNTLFYTADFLLYQVVGDDVILYVARGKDNLVFQNLELAARQLLDSRFNNYFPDREQANSVAMQESTLRVNLSDLRLPKFYEIGEEFCSIKIDTQNDGNTLNPAERALAERISGAGVKEAQINVLRPEYVKKKVAGDGHFIARIGKIERACNGSRFYAHSRGINSHIYLRGQLKKAE